MPHSCPTPRELASYTAGHPRADRRAEWTAGEYRATTHPDAHVHFDSVDDRFVVVTQAAATTVAALPAQRGGAR